jgi:hypothetical protein
MIRSILHGFCHFLKLSDCAIETQCRVRCRTRTGRKRRFLCRFSRSILSEYCTVTLEELYAIAAPFSRPCESTGAAGYSAPGGCWVTLKIPDRASYWLECHILRSACINMWCTAIGFTNRLTHTITIAYIRVG